VGDVAILRWGLRPVTVLLQDLPVQSITIILLLHLFASVVALGGPPSVRPVRLCRADPVHP
jgi:hypothetical protein